MAGITVTEKEHWKERIERRVNKRIEAIWNEVPQLKDQIDQEARRQAHQALGLTELHAERQRLEEEKEALTKRVRSAIHVYHFFCMRAILEPFPGRASNGAAT